jgi:hypothetical protein
MEDEFAELVSRITTLTGLGQREAAQVAFGFDPGYVPTAVEIVDSATDLGFDVEKKHGETKVGEGPLGPDITMNPAEVLTEVYLACPRVLCQKIPVVGRAPEQALEMFAEQLAEMPEDVVAMLIKIDVFEGMATFWLRDSENELDRPLGPVDLKRYNSDDALSQALVDLMKRLPRVLAADFN